MILKNLSKGTFFKTTFLLFLLNLFLTKLGTVQGASIILNDLKQDSVENQGIITPFSDFESETLATSRLLTSTPPSMGQILGKIKSKADSIVISPDSKTAYISLLGTGHIEVFDLSDLKSPVLLKTFTEVTWKAQKPLSALALSPDGKTLYRTDSRALDVIDVTERENLKIIGYHYDFFHRATYKPSIAVSADGNVVYTAGVGFSEIDVSVKTKPKLRYYNESEMTQVVMNKDKTKLFLADGTLRIYDCTDSNALKLLSEITPSNPELKFYTVMLNAPERSVFVSSSKVTDDHAQDFFLEHRKTICHGKTFHSRCY